MIRYKESPAGCIIYFVLSIVINSLILILRISAHEIQQNTTIAMANHRLHHATDTFATVTIVDYIKTTTAENVNDSSKYFNIKTKMTKNNRANSTSYRTIARDQRSNAFTGKSYFRDLVCGY